MTGRPREPRHFDYIDAIRGAAILGVMLAHASLCVGAFPNDELFHAAGEYGVELFFLASAITLCSSMEARGRTDRFPTAFFYLRRIFRIAPLFWIAMVVYWTIPGIIPRFWMGQWAPSGVHASYFVLTALFLNGWFPHMFNSIVPGGWSIAVEMMFYLVFPALFHLLRTARRSFLAVLVGILSFKVLLAVKQSVHADLFPGTEDKVFSFFYSLWFPAQISVFLIGILTYGVLRLPAFKKFAQSRFWASALFILSLLSLPGFMLGGGGQAVPDMLMVVLTMAAMIVTISHGGVPWVVNPVICYIGRISYSCYLVHFAALALALRMFHLTLTSQRPNFETGKPLSNVLLFAALFAVTLTLTIPVASLTVHLVEKPGIELGRRLIARLALSRRAS